MNAKPIPLETTSETGTPDACAMNPKTEKMPIPAKSSNDELAKPTTKPDPVRLALRFR